jgi:hypothetical protein
MEQTQLFDDKLKNETEASQLQYWAGVLRFSTIRGEST